jgi:hypothetical protein
MIDTTPLTNEEAEYLTVALYVYYAPGNAGPGWAQGQARNVRVPFTYPHNAVAVAREAVHGGDTTRLWGGGSEMPDSVRVVIETKRNMPVDGKSLDMARRARTVAAWRGTVQVA